MGGSSSKPTEPAVAPPKPAEDKQKKDNLKYGWEEKNCAQRPLLLPIISSARLRSVVNQP